MLDERRRSGGWVPDLGEEDHPPAEGASWAPDETVTAPVEEVDATTGAVLPGGIGRHRAPGREARWDPGRYGARSLWITGLLAAILLAGWTWLDRPRVQPVEGAPRAPIVPPPPPVGEVADASETVVVSVVGEVIRPGLVTLPSGSRVANAVAAAGGLLPGADPASVNLSAVVADGDQLAVGLPGAVAAGGPLTGGSSTPGSGGRVDLNTAGPRCAAGHRSGAGTTDRGPPRPGGAVPERRRAG